MRFSPLSLVVAAVLLGVALLIPSKNLLSALRDIPQDPVLLAKQLRGVVYFRAALLVLGLLLPFLWRALARSKKFSAPQPAFNLRIALILLLAAVLRFYDLGNGLWHDEILTLYKYIRAPIGATLTTCEDANQQFLYTLMAQVSVKVLGETNVAVRLPAVLFGVAGIWALYLLAREVADEREALLSSLLLAVSYHHVWFSQNARGYTGLLFWTLLTSLLLLRALRTNSPRLWAGYAVCVALGMYTNLALLFVVSTHFLLYLHAAVYRKQGALGFWFGFSLAGFLTFLLFSLVLPQIFGAVGGEVSTVPAWKEPLWALLEFAKALEVGFAGRVAALGALVIVTAGLMSYFRSRPEVPVLLVLPVVLCAGVTIALGHHVWPRLFFFAFGFGALVAIRGAMVAGRWIAFVLRKQEKASLAGSLLCLLMISVSALSLVRVYGPKQDFAAALQYIESNAKPDDNVAVIGLATLTYKNYYRTNWTEVESVQDLTRLKATASYTWLVYTFPPHARSVYPEVMEEVDHNFELQKEFGATVGAGNIYILRSR